MCMYNWYRQQHPCHSSRKDASRTLLSEVGILLSCPAGLPYLHRNLLPKVMSAAYLQLSKARVSPGCDLLCNNPLYTAFIEILVLYAVGGPSETHRTSAVWVSIPGNLICGSSHVSFLIIFADNEIFKQCLLSVTFHKLFRRWAFIEMAVEQLSYHQDLIFLPAFYSLWKYSLFRFVSLKSK